MFSFLSSLEISSDFSIEIVPTKTGCPILVLFFISLTIAEIFSLSVIYTKSGRSSRIIGQFVGITTVSS